MDVESQNALLECRSLLVGYGRALESKLWP